MNAPQVQQSPLDVAPALVHLLCEDAREGQPRLVLQILSGEARRLRQRIDHGGGPGRVDDGCRLEKRVVAERAAPVLQTDELSQCSLGETMKDLPGGRT